jgi:hypothetical protein
MLTFTRETKGFELTFDRVRSAGDVKLDYYGNAYCICPATLIRHVDFQRTCSGCFVLGCKRWRTVGLNHYGEPLPLESRPACEAKTRDVLKCNEKVIPGKTKCRLHGGASTGPRTSAGKERIALAQHNRWAEFRRNSGL